MSISPDNILLPPGIVLKKIEPPVMEITLDTLIDKILPIQVDWVGKLPDNLLLAGANLSPQRVRVTGPSRILERISTIYTEKIQIDNLKKKGLITAKLIIPPSLKLPTESKGMVFIDYTIKEREK